MANGGLDAPRWAPPTGLLHPTEAVNDKGVAFKVGDKVRVPSVQFMDNSEGGSWGEIISFTKSSPASTTTLAGVKVVDKDEKGKARTMIYSFDVDVLVGVLDN